jgi:hypothetical protein
MDIGQLDNVALAQFHQSVPLLYRYRSDVTVDASLALGMPRARPKRER